MNHVEHIQKINSQLDKAREFKYFVLLSCFVFFLDIALTVHNKIPLLSLTYEQIKLTIRPGDFLLFICAYTLYLSFFIPLLRYIVKLTLLSEWMSNFTYHFSSHHRGNTDTVNTLSLDDLKRFSILNNNQVALNFYNQEKSNIKSNEQLDFYCFSFLISVCINFFMGLENEGMIIATLHKYFSMQDPSIPDLIFSAASTILIVFCFGLGIIRGCGASYNSRDSIYIRNHGIQPSSKINI